MKLCALGMMVVLGCGGSNAEPAVEPALEPAVESPRRDTWTQEQTDPQPGIAAVHTTTSANFTRAVSTSSHLLIVRVVEFGMLEEHTVEGDRRYYDYAWLEVVDPLYGAMSDVIAPFGSRFPVFHMTGMQMADGSHGEGVPAAVSRLRGHTGEEVIFIGSLPTARASQSGRVPEPLAADGYDAYSVELREIAGTDQVQDVMAVVGPQ